MNPQLQVLKDEVHKQMEHYHHKRSKYRNYRTLTKLTATALTASITVLLGLTVGLSGLEILLKNIALGVSAFLTVVNTFDALYEFQSNYVSSQVAYKRLQELNFELDYYISGTKGEEVATTKLEEYKNTFTDILQNDLEEWMKVVKEQRETSKQETERHQMN